MLVTANKELYVSLPKKQKMLLSQSIVNAVRSQNPPGRFLQKDTQSDLWYDVGDKRAQEKTSQALREGAPEIRIKLQDHKPEATDGQPSKIKKESKSPKSPTKAKPEKSSSFSSRGREPQQDETEITIPVAPTSSDIVGPPVAVRHISKEQMPPPKVVRVAMACPPITIPPPIQAQGPVPERKPSKSSHGNQGAVRRPVQDPSFAAASSAPYATAESAPYYHDNPVRVRHQPEHREYHQHDYAEQQQQQQDAQWNSYSENQEVMPPPPSAMDPFGEFSFGSMGLMSDAEQARLMNGVSFGTVMSYTSTAGQERDQDQPRYKSAPLQSLDRAAASASQQQYPAYHPQQYGTQQYPSYHPQHVDIPQPVDGGLEPVGLSFGSMMSIGTAPGNKLEAAGLSFGSMMSCTSTNTAGHARNGSFGWGLQAPPDGGLQDIGTSFGSLSLAEGERERIIAEAERDMMIELAGEGAAVPTFLQQHKSKGNLLECSDTESEDEETSAEASAQKSVEWDKLQAALAAQDKSKRTTHAQAAMSRPLYRGGRVDASHPSPGTTFSIPTMGLDRGFSQMSAISVGEDVGHSPVYGDFVVPDAINGISGHYDGAQVMPPPPPEMKRGSSDDWKEDDQDLEFTFLNRGNSLASETFTATPPELGKSTVDR